MNQPIRIKTFGLSKRFILRRGPRVILRLLLSRSPAEKNVLEAVRGVDLAVASGEVVGLIGRNGSGKSTLLRLVAGILQESGGTVELAGRVLYLSGLSFCTDPALTVRDNIYQIGTIFGLRRREIKAKIAEIAGFAGLADFLDVETYKLSSGMLVRLNVSAAFSCMEHARPDVLLLDEVLSTGGDMEFQEKSMAKVEKLVKSGAAIVIASHDLPFMEKFCDRLLWLEAGAVVREGAPAEIAAAYRRSFGQPTTAD